MNKGYKKIVDTHSMPIGRTINVNIDDDKFFYECKQFEEYAKAIAHIQKYNTVIKHYPLILVVHAKSEDCHRKDYFYHREVLNALPSNCDGNFTYCFLVCDKNSPVYDLWGDA